MNDLKITTLIKGDLLITDTVTMQSQMKIKTKLFHKFYAHLFSGFPLVLIFCCVSLTAWSQDLQDQVELARSTVDAGGGESSSGDYILTGTIGQHDASVASSSSGAFLVSGGFWANSENADNNDLIFKNGFEQL